MTQFFAIVTGILFFMVMTGAILPSLISTDRLPILIILILMAAIAFFIGAVVLLVTRHVTLTKDKKPCRTYRTKKKTS